MGKRVDLKLNGNLEQQGFDVTLEISNEGAPVFCEEHSRLPASAELAQCLDQWQQSYRGLSGATRIVLQGVTIQAGRLNYPEQFDRCRQLAQQLKQQFNHWLACESFSTINQSLREILSPEDVIRVLIRTRDRQLHHLPWHLWNFFERYIHAELAIGTPTFQSKPLPLLPTQQKVRVLAILGDANGINTETDRQQLQSLPNAEVVFLSEPSRQQISQQLWEQPWHILFFAGHSRTEDHQGEARGRIFINAEESLNLGELKRGLKQAMSRGLQLAIFNSCDGLGLAYELESMGLPQIIVMRQPVPDRVAQTFLSYFLMAFTSGQSLYLSVRQARERLQEELDPYIPCTGWLPVICQNPAEVPPTWQTLMGESPAITPQPVAADRRPFLPLPSLLTLFRRSNFRQLAIVGLVSLAATALTAGIRYSGRLELLELKAFDLLMRFRPGEERDSNLLIIEITDADIQRQKQNGERMQRTSISAQSQGEVFDVSLSDQSLNQLLSLLKKYQPTVIGLDLLRDFPVDPDLDELEEQFQTLSIIAICKAENYQDESISSIDPPLEIPIDRDLNRNRIGFNDFLFDNDGVLRRHLLSLYPQLYRDSNCTTNYAFSTQVAFAYLKQQDTKAQFVLQGDYDDLQLGNKIYPVLHPQTGVYQQPAQEWGGNQILLNYRAAVPIAYRYTLNDMLHGRINPEYIRNKIVLIGVATDTQKDNWNTPYGTTDSEQMSGVYVHAHMISQLVNAALSERPLLQFWSFQQDMLWILSWSVVGGAIVWSLSKIRRDRKRWLLQLGGISVAAGVLYGLCFKILLVGIWVPLVPTLFALLFSSSAIWLYHFWQTHRSSKSL